MKENIAISLHYFVHVVCRQDDHHIQWIWRLSYSRAFSSTRFFYFFYFFLNTSIFFSFLFFFNVFVFCEIRFSASSLSFDINQMSYSCYDYDDHDWNENDDDDHWFQRTEQIVFVQTNLLIDNRDHSDQGRRLWSKWAFRSKRMFDQMIRHYDRFHLHMFILSCLTHFFDFFNDFFFSASVFNSDDFFNQHCASVTNLSADNMIRQKRKNIETIKTTIKRSKKTEEKTQKTLLERKKRVVFQNFKKILMIDSHLKISFVELIEYFELFDSNALRRWYEISSTAIDSVSEWHKARQVNFSIKNKTTDSVWIKNDVFEYILSSDSMNFFIEELPLPAHITKDIRRYKTWLRAMWAVLHDEILFFVERQIDSKATFHHEFFVENWYRTYCVFRQYHRSQTRENESTENKMSRKQNRLTISSVFLQLHEIGTASAIRRLMLFENNMSDFSIFFHFDLSDDDMKTFRNGELKIRHDDDANSFLRLFDLQQYQNVLIKIITHEKSLMSHIDDKNVRFRMTSNMQVAVVKNLSKKIFIQWFEIRDLLELISISTDQNEHRVAIRLNLTETMITRIVEKKTLDSQMRIDVDTRARFWKLQKQMNFISAMSSTFSNAQTFFYYFSMNCGVVQSSVDEASVSEIHERLIFKFH